MSQRQAIIAFRKLLPCCLCNYRVHNRVGVVGYLREEIVWWPALRLDNQAIEAKASLAKSHTVRRTNLRSKNTEISA